MRREIIIWSRLQHESIVPLFGTVCRLGNYDVTGIVSAWMAHGNLSDYLVNQLLTIFERIQIVGPLPDCLTEICSQYADSFVKLPTVLNTVRRFSGPCSI